MKKFLNYDEQQKKLKKIENYKLSLPGRKLTHAVIKFMLKVMENSYSGQDSLIIIFRHEIRQRG